MKIWKSFLRKRRALLASIVLACFAVFSGEEIYEYVSPPKKEEKDCRFAYPDAADVKPTTIALVSSDPLLPFAQESGFINDASCLNRTAIYGVVRVSRVEDVRNALAFAHNNNLKVTSAGQRHSMGGQSFSQNGLVLDMRGLNQIRLDKEHKTVNVQSGATWAEVQRALDRQGLAVQAMQSINIFTIGGALSVNAHGIAHSPGPVASTVKSFHIMLANGEVKTASPTENPELFRLALGGYGLFGVILDADLRVVNNEIYKLETQYMSYKSFPAFYEKNIEGNNEIGLVYGRLSISPTSYLEESVIHTYQRARFDQEIPLMKSAKYVWFDRLVINFSKTGGFGRWVRWTLEKYAEPRLHGCISRNEALNEKDVCLVSRNQEMYDSMAYLKNRLKDTDILQEYFVPPDKMPDFVDGLRGIVKRDGVNLLNVTIRVVHKDTITALPYAKQNMFAFVLYFNQKLNEADCRALQKATIDLIDLTTKLDGTYYLPYQLFYSKEQLHKAYPEIDAFFAAKEKYDPDGLFTNKFYEKYRN